jgi:hypothetical protein
MRSSLLTSAAIGATPAVLLFDAELAADQTLGPVV